MKSLFLISLVIFMSSCSYVTITHTHGLEQEPVARVESVETEQPAK
jgi:hypothetical protein